MMNDRLKFRTAQIGLVCLVLASGCNDNTELVEIVADGEAGVVSLKLSVEQTTLAVGETFTLTATAQLDTGGQAVLDNEVSWRSLNENIATVSSDGLVTALTPGVANIEHQWRRISGNTTVRVTEAELASIQFSTAAIDAVVCSELAVTASGVFTDGSVQPLQPDTQWSSDNVDIAEIRSQNNQQAELVFNNSGATTINLRSGDISSAVDVSVANTLAEISFGISELTLETGESQVLSVSALYSDGQQNTIDSLATYSLSSETSATQTTANEEALAASAEARVVQSADGVVSLLAEQAGTVNLSASCGGLQVVIPVTVTDPPELTSVSVDNSTTDIEVAVPLTLSLAARYSDGSVLDVSDMASWEILSGDTQIFQLNSGVLTVISDPVIEQSVLLQGQYENSADTIELVVNRGIAREVVATSLYYVDSAGLEVPATTGLTSTVGEAMQLKLQFVYNNGEEYYTTTDVFWSNVNPQIASVDATGLLTAHAAGTATILAISDNRIATMQLTVQDAPAPAEDQ